MIKSKNTVYTSILLIVGVIILINILSERFFIRLDFTEDKRFTLSDATKNILKSLTEPVTINVYFSEDLPPNMGITKKDVKDILVEYSNRSKGMLVYEFVNPNKDEETEQEALQNGIQPVMINVRDKDKVEQQKAYLGAVVQMGEEKEVIPYLEPGAALEYGLSTTIKKLAVVDKPIIGFLQGHGEPSLQAMQQVMQMLSVLYNIEPVFLTDTTRELDKYNTLAIIAPTDSLPDSHFDQLDDYLAQGKNLFVAINRVTANFQTAMGNSLSTGLESWLISKGLRVEENFVIDANCGRVSVQQGNFPFPLQINFPYFPIISNFGDHPITEGLEAVILQMASSITFTGDTSLVFTPLAVTSEKSGTQSSPTYFQIQKNWTENDFPLSGLTVAGLLSGPIVGNANSNIVLVSNGNFAVNGEGGQPQQVNPDNASLLVNSIDWLSDDTGLIDLRTKGISSRPLEQVEESKKMFLKLFNFLLPIILVILYGIVRMQINRNLRMKRMEEGYV